jgi:hypothetical protein
MNQQSMGALLILGGLAMLWAIWSQRSPFRTRLWGGEGTPGRPSGAAAFGEGVNRGFWGAIPGGGLVVPPAGAGATP